MQDENNSRNVTTGDGGAGSAVKAEDLFPMDFIGNMFRNWRVLVIGALLGSACGIGAYFVATPKWQANLLVQVGKVSSSVERDSTLIEGVGQTAYRIRSKEFVDAVIKKSGYAEVGNGENEPPEVVLFRSSLKPNDVAGTDFVKVEFLGYSRERLKKYADSLAQELLAAHNRIPDALKTELKSAQEKNNNELAGAESTYERLTKEFGRIQQQPQDAQLLSASVMTAQIQNSAALIESLRKVQRDLERRLFPTNLYPTVISQVEIDNRPASPKLRIFLLAGFALGLVCGFVFSIFRRTTRLDRLP